MDTTVWITVDATNKVLEVQRSISARDLHWNADYSRAERELTEAYGAPYRCDQSDDLGTTDAEYWNHRGVHDELVRSVTLGRVIRGTALGGGWCHSGPE